MKSLVLQRESTQHDLPEWTASVASELHRGPDLLGVCSESAQLLSKSRSLVYLQPVIGFDMTCQMSIVNVNCRLDTLISFLTYVGEITTQKTEGFRHKTKHLEQVFYSNVVGTGRGKMLKLYRYNIMSVIPHSNCLIFQEWDLHSIHFSGLTIKKFEDSAKLVAQFSEMSFRKLSYELEKKKIFVSLGMICPASLN